jgi:hypothetical protein
MYLAEADEIFQFWKDSPPTYQLVALIARMLGWEPQPREIEGELPDWGVEMPPEVAEKMGQAVGLPAPIVSLDEMRERNRQRMIEIAERNKNRKDGS